jgi:hypothetical protein
MNSLWYFFIGIIFAAICYTVAGQKGKNVTLWAVLGFFFGFIPLIILLIMKPEPGSPKAR